MGFLPSSEPARWRKFALLLPVLCGVIVATGVAASAPVQRLEQDSVQARFRIRGTQPPPRNVVIVAYDDRSAELLGQRPPVARSLHARLLDRLRLARPKVIAYDIQFTEPTVSSDDLALYDAVGRARPVVLATADVTVNGDTRVLGSTANVERVGGRVGAALYPLGPGGIYNRMIGRANGLPTFAVVTAELAGARPRPDDLAGSGALIDYLGPPGTVRTFSFVDVLKGGVPAAGFRGKVVVVGVTAVGSEDVHPTPAPGGNQMSGSEIQASAIATVLRDFPLRDAGSSIDTLAVLLLSIAGAIAGRRWDPPLALAVTVVVAVAFAALTQVAFDSGMVLTTVAPLLGMGVSALGAVAVEQRTVRRERGRLAELVAHLAPGEDPERVLERVAGTGEDAVLLEGARFGAYRIGGLLGLGAMGVVYRAHHGALDRSVAIKVLAPVLAADERIRERLRREALNAARLEHPNVVGVFDAGVHQGRMYIAMQLVEGRPLDELVGTPQLTTQRMVEVVEMVAAGLDHAHERGVVHRDVKPQNILVEEATGRALLADFGIAAAAEQERLTALGDLVGTVAYAAPEQLAGAEPDRLVDVYALGCVLFELLTGHLPFERATLPAAIQAHLTDPPPAVSTWRSDLRDSGIDGVVMRALAKTAKNRWQSAGALADAARATLMGPVT